MATLIVEARLREALDYEPETGLFRWKIQIASRVPGDIAGNHTHGYIEIGLDGVSYRAHHLAWLFVYGEIPDLLIDHIDGNRANNRISNLRLATQAQNLQNLRKSRGKYTILLGVTYHKQAGKWLAQIRVNGRNKSLGLFDSAEDAHIAYLHAKREFHPFGAIAHEAELPPLPKRRATTDSSVSGYRGVSLDKRRGTWAARIAIGGKYKSLGSYSTPEEAFAACEAARSQNQGINTMRADSEVA